MAATDQLRCGACGCDTVTVHGKRAEARASALTWLRFTCTQCACETTLALVAPAAELHGDDKGTLTGGWRDKER